MIAVWIAMEESVDVENGGLWSCGVLISATIRQLRANREGAASALLDLRDAPMGKVLVGSVVDCDKRAILHELPLMDWDWIVL